MVATKIFKKCSPHGRLYLYLGQREFISADGLIDDIKGIAYVPELNEIQGIFIYLINEGSSLLFFQNFSTHKFCPCLIISCKIPSSSGILYI